MMCGWRSGRGLPAACARRHRFSSLCCDSICISMTRCSSACRACCTEAESGPEYEIAYEPALQYGQLRGEAPRGLR